MVRRTHSWNAYKPKGVRVGRKSNNVKQRSLFGVVSKTKPAAVCIAGCYEKTKAYVASVKCIESVQDGKEQKEVAIVGVVRTEKENDTTAKILQLMQMNLKKVYEEKPINFDGIEMHKCKTT